MCDKIKIAGYEDKILCGLSLVLVLFVCGINFWALDRGLISSDEGWYLYLFRDQVIEIKSHGHILFGAFPCLKDIYLNRLVCYLLFLVSTAMLFGGFHLWCKEKLGIKMSPLVVAGLGCLVLTGIHSCPSINYTQLIHIAASASLGVLLAALVCERWWVFCLSGLFLSMLFSVKITSLCIVPFIIATILISSERPQRHIWSFLLGLAGGILLHIFLIESPQDIFRWFAYNLNNAATTSSANTHDFSSLLRWVFNTALFYAQWFIVAYVIYWLPQTLDKSGYLKRRKSLRYAVFTAVVLFLIYFYWHCMKPETYLHDNWQLLKGIVGIVTILVILHSLEYRQGKHMSVLLLLFVTPPCICFGTDVDFLTNSQVSYIAQMLAVAASLPEKKAILYKRIFILMFIAVFYGKAKGNYHNWHGDLYMEQTVPLRSIGVDEDIMLDSAYIERIKFYKTHLSEGAKVVNTKEKWSFVTLLRLQAIATDWDFNEEEVLVKAGQYIENGEPVWLLYSSKELTHNREAAFSSLRERLGRKFHETIFKNGNDYLVKFTK